MTDDEGHQLIKKTVLRVGLGSLPCFVDGTKVTFHFRTAKCDDDSAVIDDSHVLGKPMELILGKKFKLEAWESCVKTMRVNEVARFVVDRSLACAYPWVAKTLRTALSNAPAQPSSENAHSHCCGMMALQKEGLGHHDLDELIQTPQDLVFTLELIGVEDPGDYEKESWAMNEEEKLGSIPKLKDEGNRLYAEKKYLEASRKYAEALGRLEQLQLKEKPADEEWRALDAMKIPLLLNYSQCKLVEEDYYTVIEHTTTVLDKEPGNVKALFRRAKAHVGAWNPREARADFEKVKALDDTLGQVITKELVQLDQLIQIKNKEDKDRFQGKIF